MGINIPFLQQREVISGQMPSLKYTLFSIFPSDLGIQLGEVRKLDVGRKLFRVIGWELTCE